MLVRMVYFEPLAAATLNEIPPRALPPMLVL
jgi:hypothetical protein